MQWEFWPVVAYHHKQDALSIFGILASTHLALSIFGILASTHLACDGMPLRAKILTATKYLSILKPFYHRPCKSCYSPLKARRYDPFSTEINPGQPKTYRFLLPQGRNNAREYSKEVCAVYTFAISRNRGFRC